MVLDLGFLQLASMIHHLPILLVEDNEDDAFLMTRSLKAAGILQSVHVAGDGQQAIDYLAGQGPYADREKYPLPSVVFLDLKLPFKSGHEVLAWIKGQRALAEIIVVVLTSSNQPSDLEEAYRLGANSYVVKPPAAQQLVEMATAFKNFWFGFNCTSGG
jgi:CheY-like chemotaxis protein